MQSTVTIKDVASRAGVAVSTVSRVINKRDRVSPKTRKKVLQAIDELEYVRNNLAASIKTGTTRFIVAVVPDIINEFYTAVIRGVEEVARAKGYYTLVHTTKESAEQSVDAFDERFSRMVDGIILVPAMADKTIYENFDKPVVIVDREIPKSHVYSVTVDNYKGACILAQELIDNGHTKIAFVIGASAFNVTFDRMKGFLDTLVKNNIKPVDAYICRGSWYRETGYQVTEYLLNLPDPPTAVFAGNNQICIGCAKYMLEHGLQIGRDISLVGFDDSEVMQYLGSGITSIDRPTFEMGRIGAEMLVALLENRVDSILEKKVKLDVKLIRRHSVARLSQ